MTPAPILKCACAIKSNAHFVKYLKSGIYHDSSKCACANEIVFSMAPESAVSYQKGVYIHTLVGRRRALYRWTLKTIYNLVRVSGHGGRSGSPLTDRKLKSNAHAHLPGSGHGSFFD